MQLKDKINFINECFESLLSKKIHRYKINLIVTFISNFLEFKNYYEKSKYNNDRKFFNSVLMYIYNDQFFLSKFSNKNIYLLKKKKINLFQKIIIKKNNFQTLLKITISIIKIIFLINFKNKDIVFYHPEKNNSENIKKILKKEKYDEFFLYKYSDYTFFPNHCAKKKKIENKETINVISLLKKIFVKYNMVNEYNHLKGIINDNLFYNLKYLKKLFNFFINQKKIIIVDTNYSILRNGLLNIVHNTKSINLIGYQHGGGYCELASHHRLMLEESSPIYNYGYINWGIFSNDHSAYMEKKINLIKFYKSNVIFYPTSGDLKAYDAFTNIRDTSYKRKLFNLIKSIENPYFIKFHPTLNMENITNLEQNDFYLGGHKPGICEKNIKYVILDSPGSTLFFECLKKNIPFIFCMPYSLFDLTDEAKNMYNDFEKNNKFINLDKNNYYNKLQKLLNS